MTRARWFVIVVLAIGVGVVWWSARRGDAHEPPPAAPAARTARAPFTMDQLFEQGRVKAGMVDGPHEPAPAQGAAGSVDEVAAEVLDSDPELRRFHELRRKALRTSAEQRDYLAMISNPALIEDARADLLAAIESAELDQRDELRRLQRIQFLNSALAWRDNPQRVLALDAVQAVVMTEIPATTMRDVKGSVLGDKFDLFQLLATSDPDRASALLARSRGSSLENILRLAWQATPAGRSDRP